MGVPVCGHKTSRSEPGGTPLYDGRMHRAPDPEQGHRPRRRALVATVVASGLALALVLIALPRLLWEPGLEAPGTVSCAAYGLPELTVPSRPGHRPLGDGPVLSQGPRLGEGPADRWDVAFEHEGVTSTYHVFADGIDWSRPVGVVFRLHGDGAYEFHHPQRKLSCLAEVARSHNAILVAPRTPDRTGEPTWWEDLDGNAEWFLALAEQRVFAEYDLDRSRTWLHGYSGGAEFISYELLADRIGLLEGGGAILSGGGGAPAGAASAPTAEQRADLRLHWDVGADDDGTDPHAPFDALRAARAGEAWYDRRGFERTSLQVREDTDHFELPEAQVLDRLLTAAEG